MPVTIRRADITDAASLAEVGARLFEQTYKDSIPADEMSAHLAEDFGEEQQRAEFSDPAVVSFIVEDDGAVVGFAQVRAKPLPVEAGDPANVELWRIYLDESLHGRGVAQRLLKEVGAAARSMQANGIWLAVWEKNPRAISFYTKHGFARVGRQDFHVGGEVHCDAVLRAPPDAL